MQKEFGQGSYVRDDALRKPNPATQSGLRGDNAPIRVITQSYADDVVVNAKELAHALRVSRWTVSRWREEGYQFEFGNRSTPGDLKAWLRERASQGKT